MDDIKTKPVTKEYSKEFDRIFGERDLPPGKTKVVYDSKGRPIDSSYPWSFKFTLEGILDEKNT